MYDFAHSDLTVLPSTNAGGSSKPGIWPSFIAWLTPVLSVRNLALFFVMAFILDDIKSGFVGDVTNSGKSLWVYHTGKIHTYCRLFPDGSNCSELLEKWNGGYVSPQDKFNQETKADMSRIVSLLVDLQKGYKELSIAQKSGDREAMQQIEQRIRRLETALTEATASLAKLEANLGSTSITDTSSERMTLPISANDLESDAVLHPLTSNQRASVPLLSDQQVTTASGNEYPPSVLKRERVIQETEALVATTANRAQTGLGVNTTPLLNGVGLMIVPSYAREPPNITFKTSPIDTVRDVKGVVEFQLRARRLGYYTGPVDGIFGKKSQIAINTLNAIEKIPNRDLSYSHLKYLRERTADVDDATVQASLDRARNLQLIRASSNDNNFLANRLSPTQVERVGSLTYGFQRSGRLLTSQSNQISSPFYDNLQNSFGASVKGQNGQINDFNAIRVGGADRSLANGTPVVPAAISIAPIAPTGRR